MILLDSDILFLLHFLLFLSTSSNNDSVFRDLWNKPRKFLKENDLEFVCTND